MTAKHLVILVPGIRDVGSWMDDLRRDFAPHGIVTAGAHNGFFGLVGFLWPFGSARRRAMQQVEQHVRTALTQHKDAARVSIIAHSFGSYMVASILDNATDLFRGEQKLSQVILCGSVLPRQFNFDRIQQRVGGRFVNEVGCRDIFPVLAEALSFIFGSAGTYGFTSTTITDRFHAKAGHGTYFEAGFAQQWWVPVLVGELPLAMPHGQPAHRSARTPWHFRLITETQRYLAVLALVALVLVLEYAHLHYLFPQRPIGLPAYQEMPSRLGDGLARLVQEAKRVNPLPDELDWLGPTLLGRPFPEVTFSSDLTRLDTCRPEDVPDIEAGVTDPFLIAGLVEDALPQCLRMDGIGTSQVQFSVGDGAVPYINSNGEERLLCACTGTQIAQIKQGE